jgi:1,4-alpha-glucan branching enzyme
MNQNIPLRAINYQWEKFLYTPKFTPKKNYENSFGYKVISRDNGFAKEVRFQILSKNILEKIFIVGDFNDWGKSKNISDFELQKKGDFSYIDLECIKHKEPYLFLINNKYLKDPASVFFDDVGNSIFWDFDNPYSYKLKYEKPERLHSSTKILQTDPKGLIDKWHEYININQNKKTLSLEESKKDIFSYIKDCGVLKKIKELGFNNIQFLPIAQAIDGDNWKYKYLVSYPFALNKNLGNPDSFLKLIDECHKLGISVILDIILSHAPYTKFKLFNFEGIDVGIHNWTDSSKKEIYLDELTYWGTKRYKYSDKHIRDFLTESIIHFLTNFYVDGFRIDNVDGILRHGDTGQGEERIGGREFLQETIKKIYECDEYCLIHLESHYFFGNNAKELIEPINFSKRSLGATAYGSSRETFYLHSEYMPKSADKISIWTLEHIKKEKEWGNSNSCVADFHNHDAAAGLMVGRATGSYAYDAITLNDNNLKNHAIGKIKVMESFIAFGLEGRILDLLQTFLLQKGSFEHDCSIDWKKLNEEDTKKLVNFKKEINILLNKPAFWPENVINRKYTNIDDTNKILVREKKDTTQKTNEEYVILINFSGAKIHNYCFGVNEINIFKIIFDSENKSINKKIKSTKSNKFEFFSNEIIIEEILPYEIIVFEKEKQQ